MCSGGYFCQVLEGDADRLEHTFERIQQDPRHTDCRLVFFEPADQREFRSWNMVLATIEHELHPAIRDILASPRELDTTPAGRELLEYLLTAADARRQEAAAIQPAPDSF